MTDIEQTLQEKIIKIRKTYTELGVPLDKIRNELERCNAVDLIIRNNPVLSRWGLSPEELYGVMQKKTSDQFGLFFGNQEDFLRIYSLSLSVPIESYVLDEQRSRIESKDYASVWAQDDRLRQYVINGPVSIHNTIGHWATVRSGRKFIPDDKVHDGAIVVETHNLETYGLLFDRTVIAGFDENSDEPYTIQTGDLLIGKKYPWTMTVVAKIDGMVMVAGKDVLIVRPRAAYTAEFIKIILDSEMGQRMMHVFCPLPTSEIIVTMVEAFCLPEVKEAVVQRMTKQYEHAAESCHNKILMARRLFEDEEAELASLCACSGTDFVIE